MVEKCGDEDFDRFVAQAVTAMLGSKGFSSEQLKEAMTMGTLVTEFQRSLGDIRQEGREQGIEVGQLRILRHLAARKFGRQTAEELARMLAGGSDGEHITRVAAAIVECDAPDEFLVRARGGSSPRDANPDVT